MDQPDLVKIVKGEDDKYRIFYKRKFLWLEYWCDFAPGDRFWSVEDAGWCIRRKWLEKTGDSGGFVDDGGFHGTRFVELGPLDDDLYKVFYLSHVE